MHSISLLYATLPVFIYGFPQGAPGVNSVCINMEPGHRDHSLNLIKSQPMSTFPLVLTNKQVLKTKHYGGNGYVTFKLDGNFKGAIFQVRDETEQVVGEFCDKKLPETLQFVEICSKYGIPKTEA